MMVSKGQVAVHSGHPIIIVRPARLWEALTPK